MFEGELDRSPKRNGGRAIKITPVKHIKPQTASNSCLSFHKMGGRKSLDEINQKCKRVD